MRMLTDSDIEALARALGVLIHDYTIWPKPGQFRVIDTGGQFCIVTPPRADGVGASEPVDRETTAIVLLGHARGLRVDLGECPACRARGSKRGLAMYEWAALWHHRGRGWSPATGVLDGHGEGATNWTLSLTPSGHISWQHAARPCPECTIDGKPTGRRTISWERAVLDAMRRPLRPDDPAPEHPDCIEYGGDRATREALAVLADQLQTLGDPLGQCVAAQLNGECQDCERTGLVARPGLPFKERCESCRGHGTKVRALGRELHDLVVKATLDALPRLPDGWDWLFEDYGFRAITWLPNKDDVHRRSVVVERGHLRGYGSELDGPSGGRIEKVSIEVWSAAQAANGVT